MAETDRVNINIDKSLKKRAQIYALENDVTLTDVILAALESYLSPADSSEEQKDSTFEIE